MNRSVLKEIAVDGGICLLAVAALPILALLGIALRGAVLLAIILAAALCVLIYPISARFREWFKIEAEIEYRHRGLRLARDVLLYPAHSWARWGTKAVTVGADDLLLSLIGPVEAVELPATGTHVEQGEALFRVSRGERSVDVLSPLSGSVCASNQVLALYPELMNELPFSEGWAVRVKPESEDHDRRALLPPPRARAWFRSEVDRAIDSAGPQPPAGGRLHRCIDTAAWERLSHMFKQRRAASLRPWQVTN
ncbi:MAG: hypothetical protein IT430_04160 [Phycisphaerales bacterium]|nr:hypothetical protein [Phycisphaerales bacterium]